MLRLLPLSLLFCIHLQCCSQVSDILSVRRKNGRLIKTFVAGSPIIFETKHNAYVEGPIKEIKNDSVFVTMYDIRTVPTNLGVTVVDTVARYVVAVRYKEISRIKVFRRRRFVRGKIDKFLVYGGAGYFGLNIINGVVSKQPVTSTDNVKKLGIAAGAFAAGLLIKNYFYVNRFSRKRHKIVYIRVK